MKKLLVALLVAVFAVGCLFTVSADSPDFKIKIDGKTVVSAGDTVEYTVSVSDISVENGIASVTATLKYDTSFFDASSVTITRPEISGWIVDEPLKSNGTIVFNAYSDMGSDGNLIGITENGKITFKVSMKVLEGASDDSGVELYIVEGENDTFGGDINTDYLYNVDCGKLDLTLMKKLSTPSGLTFENKTAKWNAVENASGYTLQLYKDGEKLGNAVNCTGTNYNFSTDVEKNLGGAYSFTVTATSTSSEYGDSDTAKSDAVNYRGSLLSPEIGLTVDKIKGSVSFKITDPNPDDTVSAYIIKVYDGNEVVKEFTSTGKSGAIEGLTLGKEYSVTVTANSASIDNQQTGNNHSNESGKEKVKTDGIVGIKVNKKPKLSYTEGDTLDLSSMEITVDFAVASDVKVKRSKFSEYGITVTPKHGADITLSMNGKKLTVTCGDLTAEAELVLEVQPAECPHGSTLDEHQDATCGANGFDRSVCSLCGETVTETVIPATGEHEYGEWEWKSKPTTAIDGVRERRCAKCEGVEIDQVTYAEYIAMTSTDTSETEPPETTPEETTKPTPPETTDKPKRNNALGGIGDLGKIFLFALIAILVVVVLFIVGAIYIESRQNRRRKSRARTNQAKTQNRTQNASDRNKTAKK